MINGLATAWVFLVAAGISVLATWMIANKVALFVPLTLLASAGLLFALGVMLTKKGHRW